MSGRSNRVPLKLYANWLLSHEQNQNSGRMNSRSNQQEEKCSRNIQTLHAILPEVSV